MTALGIVEVVDVVCNGDVGCHLRRVPFVIEVFTFQGCEDGFRNGVVPTIARAAHATSDTKTAEALRVLFARVRTTAVGVMNESRWWPSVSHCCVQGR